MGDWPVPGYACPVGWHAHGRDWDITYRHGQTVEACVDAIADQIISRNGGIVLLHDFVSATEFVPAVLTQADLDLRIVEITQLLIGRLRRARLSLCRAAGSRTGVSAAGSRWPRWPACRP